MPSTRNGTERPREPSLQLYIDFGYVMCRIGGRLRSCVARHGGVIVEIPPLIYLESNPANAGDSEEAQATV